MLVVAGGHQITVVRSAVEALAAAVRVTQVEQELLELLIPVVEAEADQELPQVTEQGVQVVQVS
jgi:hypothetical protein